MNVGALRERVTLQVPSSSAGTDGEYGQPTWRKLATVYAQVTPLTARERLSAQALQASIAYRVVVRDRDDVTPKARVVCLGPDYGHSTFQIHSVVRNHKAGSMEMDCSEVMA